MDDTVGKKRVYFGFTGPINPETTTRIASAFNQGVNDGYNEIYLSISSCGGFNSDGFFLYNHIRGLPVDVVIYNTGSIMSVAAIIYIAATKRYCSKHGIFMIHPTEMPPPPNNRAETLRLSSDGALADDQRTENILRERASIPASILQDRRFKEVYITPKQALKFGLAHAICEFSLPKGSQIFQI